MEYSDINPGSCGFFCSGEVWDVRVQGDQSGSSADDEFFRVNQANASPTTQSFFLDINSDGGGENAFATTLSDKNFEFWFSESTANWLYGDQDFKLYSATLEVSGVTSVVPIPAAAWLFGSALVGIGAVGRRKRAKLA